MREDQRTKEQSAWEGQGATEAEWAILMTAGYQVPLARGPFARQAAWESRCGCPPQAGDVTEAQAREAIDSCLAKGWIRLTDAASVEPRRDALGRKRRGTETYPQNGVVLTAAGWRIHRQIAAAIKDIYRKAR